jgi:hypothetical protein
MELLGDVGHVESRFDPFEDRVCDTSGTGGVARGPIN